MPPEELTGWLTRVAAEGLSAKIHCTGDASVRMALDAVETIRAQGHTGAGVQIAHAPYVEPTDLKRFAELDVSVDISRAVPITPFGLPVVPPV